jgi:hypothetical protein
MQMVADGCSMSQSYGGFLYLGVSKNCWFKMTKPIKIDDLGVPVFQETTIMTRHRHPTKTVWGIIEKWLLMPFWVV